MSDYNVTRRVATKITDRFSNMLRNLEDDFEEEVVVCSLMKYHSLCSVPVKDEGGMDMCRLRLPADTQQETRVVAQQVDTILKDLYPVSWVALIGETK